MIISVSVFDTLQLHTELRHIQGADPLQSPAPSCHSSSLINIFSLTDNPEVSSSPSVFSVAPSRDHPVSSNGLAPPPSSPALGGLLRQGCGGDVTGGAAGYRESLPSNERSHQTEQ
ncbi:hypothetical protein PBY51_007319 [Eleginops maclovinus]|uniref:Uncharacterized protein n=1 Tax=Eleginops maclovinus TaxID=56733 RepID=A0AAN7X107_ELEMC|nr:hypothetical protein PBY51_007319 [Eleginops maclovinus]